MGTYPIELTAVDLLKIVMLLERDDQTQLAERINNQVEEFYEENLKPA